MLDRISPTVRASGLRGKIDPVSERQDLERVPVILSHLSGVVAGLFPAIHVFLLKARKKDVDGADGVRAA
jgi:hypothetical protein